MCIRDRLGAGISYGYKLPLSKHWGAEFNLGVGYANMKYNTYYNVDNGAQLDTGSYTHLDVYKRQEIVKDTLPSVTGLVT